MDSQGGHNSESDGEDSDPYFMQISFHLRKITEAPAASGDDTKLVGEDRAQLMQKLLDEQVVRLTSSERMLKFLRRQIKDPLPCKRSNQHHVRRLIQILLHKIEGQIHEKEHSEDMLIFEVIEGTQRPLPAAAAVGATASLSSQLSFQSRMARPQVNDVGK